MSLTRLLHVVNIFKKWLFLYTPIINSEFNWKKKIPFIPPRVTSSHHHEKQREKNMVPVGSSWEDANKGFYIGLLHVPEPESAMVVGGEMGGLWLTIYRLRQERSSWMGSFSGKSLLNLPHMSVSPANSSSRTKDLSHCPCSSSTWHCFSPVTGALL